MAGLVIKRLIGTIGLISVLVVLSLVAAAIWAPVWLTTAGLLGGLAIGASCVLLFARVLRSQLSHG